MVRFKDWTGNKRGKQLMSKEKHKKNLKNYYLRSLKKLQASLASWKQHIKEWGMSQDFCTVLQSTDCGHWQERLICINQTRHGCSGKGNLLCVFLSPKHTMLCGDEQQRACNHSSHAIYYKRNVRTARKQSQSQWALLSSYVMHSYVHEPSCTIWNPNVHLYTEISETYLSEQW